MNQINDTKILIPQLNKTLKNKHVSYDVVCEFLGSIPYSSIILQNKTNYYEDKFAELIYKKSPSTFTLYQSLKKTDNNNFFFGIYMGLNNLYGFNTLLKSNFRSIYLFDAWENCHDQITTFVNSLKIDILFVSSRQATERLKQKLPKHQIIWCAEGCCPEIYKQKKYNERHIDILQLGRRYEYIHKHLKKLPSTIFYAHQNDDGSLLFPTHQEFIEGLSNSKISICVPQTFTHPNVAKGIETVTNRYFQSIASKCLVLGHAPQELIDIWGYNPIIELDYENIEDQVTFILNNYKKYLPLIERNYIELITNHTWKVRWDAINEILSNESSWDK